MVKEAFAAMGDMDARQDRRRRMVKAARRIFVEKGYEATSLDDIIAEVGGSRRNVYSDFGGKRDLLDAVVEQIIDEIAGTADLPDDQATSPRAWLIAVSTDYVGLMLSPGVISVIRQFTASGGADAEQAGRLWRSGPVRFRDRIEAWLHRQNRLGVLDVPDPGLVARILPEMMRGSFLVELLIGHRREVTAAELRDHVVRTVDFLLPLLGPRPAVAPERPGPGGNRA